MSWLIEPQALAELLQNAEVPVRLLDCRADLQEPEKAALAYGKGHIPNALHAHLERDLSGPVVPGKTGRHPLPEPAVWQATLRRWGIHQHSSVVVYDAGNSMFAARAWWLLRWAGLTRVQVLHGGWHAWQRLGLPETT
ncbi:MAG: rhodanese-like domain-containing protein, partial [Natronospirillum sp.]